MRFGILGDAKIAREKLLPAMRKGGHEIIHLAKRDISQPVESEEFQRFFLLNEHFGDSISVHGHLKCVCQGAFPCVHRSSLTNNLSKRLKIQ